MPKVVVTYPYTTEELAALKDRCELVVCTDKDRESGNILDICKGADVVITLLTDQIDAAFFDGVGPQLKLVAQNSVGFNNIDLVEAEKRGIAVANVPGGATGNAIAEHSMALLLALARKVPAADQFMRAGKYQGWDPTLFVGTEIQGKTLGIIGAGHSGAAFARIAHHGFGMRIVYTDMHRNPSIEQGTGALFMTKEKLLTDADIVSLHVPLTEETRHLIGKEEFLLMKKSAFLLNLARGPVIDEEALVQALTNNQIGGAALDVYEDEPAIASGLNDLENIVLSPHIASATREARHRMLDTTVRSVLLFLDGQPLLNRVSAG